MNEEEASINNLRINSHVLSEENEDDNNSRVRLRDHNNDYLDNYFTNSIFEITLYPLVFEIIKSKFI